MACAVDKVRMNHPGRVCKQLWYGTTAVLRSSGTSLVTIKNDVSLLTT